MTLSRNSFFLAQLAVWLVGFCAFINLYAPQAILPLLSQEFHASAAEVSTIMTASTLAVAITAPFIGTIADVLGRKRVIVFGMFVLAVPTFMVAFSGSLPQFVFWRAVQGLILPLIFAVTVAYIGDEWPPKEATKAASLYTSGSGLGGFCGRLLPGIIADLISWRISFIVLGFVALAGASVVAFVLPHEKKHVRSEGLLASTRQMLSHLRNTQLVATYAVGFGVLFNFIATFTYITFHLASAPYNLTPSALGLIFFVYLIGSTLTPWISWAISKIGRRQFMIALIVIWAGGVALTLLPGLPAIIFGLTICACAGMLCQATSTGYVTVTAKAGRSSAVGLYVTSFYVGGSFGAALGGIAWGFGKWPACAALIFAMLAILLTIVITLWTPRAPPGPAMPVEPA